MGLTSEKVQHKSYTFVVEVAEWIWKLAFGVCWDGFRRLESKLEGIQYEVENTDSFTKISGKDIIYHGEDPKQSTLGVCHDENQLSLSGTDTSTVSDIQEMWKNRYEHIQS